MTAEGVHPVASEVDAQLFRPRRERVERVGTQSFSDQAFAWLKRNR